MHRAVKNITVQLKCLSTLSTILSKCLYLILLPLSKAYRPLDRQIKIRQLLLQNIDKIQQKRSLKKIFALFFCSSAGEYEQALPLIRQFEHTMDAYVLIIFFSPSGYEFAHAKKELRDFYLSPLDHRNQWRDFFSRLKPDFTIVVRHEIWPSFLEQTILHSRAILINASVSTNDHRRRFLNTYKKILLNMFDHIFFVSKTDYTELNNIFRLTKPKKTVCGDTKHQQSFEKSKANGLVPQQLATYLKAHSLVKKIVVGSAWQKDIDLMIETCQNNKDLLKHFQFIIVPHKPHRSLVESLVSRCFKNNMSCRLYSSIVRDTLESGDPQANFIIIDQIGFLAELYGFADMAFIGGALHYQVHNVLEPLPYRIPIAFGPLFQNSREAVELIEENIASVIKNPSEMLNWIHSSNCEMTDRLSSVESYLNRNLSSSKTIMCELAAKLKDPEIKCQI